MGDAISVSNGKKRTTTLVASDNAVVLVEKGKQQAIRHDVNITVQEIIAPASQGTRFGEATIFIGDQAAATVDLVLEEDLEKGSFVDRLKWWIVNTIS